MRKQGKPTSYPGVYKLGKRKFRVRGKICDPRTGKGKEVDRVLDDVTAPEAARMRAELLAELKARPEDRRDRIRVREYVDRWLASKRLKLDQFTADRYEDALRLHVIPGLGAFYYDALTSKDVQAWVDDALTSGRMVRGETKPYSRDSVHGWFRVLRTMTRDAMDELGLQRDATLRVTFPDVGAQEEANALTHKELARFLEAMREGYVQHFALTAVLAFSGLRFCHASALKWDDLDAEAGILYIRRKQVRRKVGRVSRKKQAPRAMPIEPELVAVLREHRRRLVSENAPGLAEGWMFPSRVGTPRNPSSVSKAWGKCLKAAGINRRFTVHGLRYTFTDLIRPLADPVVRRALTGHVTEAMQDRYSHVHIDEKRSAVAGVHRLVKLGTEEVEEADDATPDSVAEEVSGEELDEQQAAKPLCQGVMKRRAKPAAKLASKRSQRRLEKQPTKPSTKSGDFGGD